MRLHLLLLFVLRAVAVPTIAQAPDPAAAERKTIPGRGPAGAPQVTFCCCRSQPTSI